MQVSFDRSEKQAGVSQPQGERNRSQEWDLAQKLWDERKRDQLVILVGLQAFQLRCFKNWEKSLKHFEVLRDADILKDKDTLKQGTKIVV